VGESTLHPADHRFRLHPTLPWKVFFHRVSYEVAKDNVFGRAAELAYFFLFSLLLASWTGRWPGLYFMLFAAPGFLHIATSILARLGRADRFSDTTR